MTIKEYALIENVSFLFLSDSLEAIYQILNVLFVVLYSHKDNYFIHSVPIYSAS
jgi:hypothetical protein